MQEIVGCSCLRLDTPICFLDVHLLGMSGSADHIYHIDICIYTHIYVHKDILQKIGTTCKNLQVGNAQVTGASVGADCYGSREGPRLGTHVLCLCCACICIYIDTYTWRLLCSSCLAMICFLLGIAIYYPRRNYIGVSRYTYMICLYIYTRIQFNRDVAYRTYTLYYTYKHTYTHADKEVWSEPPPSPLWMCTLSISMVYTYMHVYMC